ncbi:MAG TPA: paraquat-inducible protein A, partial [Bdellovibrionales bacterium]|nr:paraquat-inducible protein A [Bdellovibrionales bacterium]
SLAFALTALILYVPANLFPFMTIELYGSRNSSTIWQGILTLVEKGSFFIAIVVFLASILIPAVKLVILFYLGATAGNGKHARSKTYMYHAVEAIGRWSMLDIFLLAVLVAIMKLGPWTTVRPEPGALMFLLVVIFTMLSSAYFDPQLIWENHDEEKN